MPRYFYSERAGLQYSGITFKPIGIFGGRMCGIIETENEGTIAILLAGARSGISEVNAADYAKLLAQKKTTNSTPLPDSNLPPVSRGPALAEKVGVESAGSSVSVASSSERVLTPKECIQIDAVNSPDAFIDERNRVATVAKKLRKRAA